MSFRAIFRYMQKISRKYLLLKIHEFLLIKLTVIKISMFAKY